MKFILESLKIRYFKGLREQDITFDPVETTICGENGTGKTTVVDAFKWLLFEKDSLGRSQFEIKTLENGEVIHGLDHLVEGIFKIDGRPLKLRKIYKEVWTKRKGEEQEVFTRHEIERFINDIPVTRTDYNKRINELIDEKIFQLLTDPLYFSQQLEWKERRTALFQLAGEDVTTEDVIKINRELQLIQQDLEDKTIEELQETLKYQRRELNKEREHIPVKIKTLQGTVKEVDKSVVDMRCRVLKGNITKIEEQMLDATKMSEERLKKQDELTDLKLSMKEIEYRAKINIKDPDEEFKIQISEFKSKLRELESESISEKRTIDMLERNLTSATQRLNELRHDYTAETERELKIDENIKACPTCERPFSQEEVGHKIAELEENFKGNQVNQLKRLREKGQETAQEVKEYQEELDQAYKTYKEKQGEIELIAKAIKDREELLGTKPKADIQTLLKENNEYQSLRAEIEKLEVEVKNRQHSTALDELKSKKLELELELKETEKDLHQDEINQSTREKIEELMVEEKELSKKINEIEKKEDMANEFISTKSELIEKKINEKFEKVTFRLFKKQTNGGVDPTCEVLVDGVPFDNANTAGQVNAGLDVINSLCRHYNIYTPIFIDNRESVNELIATDSQLINLKVTRHKTLRIEQN